MPMTADRLQNVPARRHSECQNKNDAERRGECSFRQHSPFLQPLHQPDPSAVDRAEAAKEPWGVIERDGCLIAAIGPRLVVDTKDSALKRFDLVKEVPEADHGAEDQ